METVMFKVINRKRIVILNVDPTNTISNLKDQVCELIRREKTEISLILNGKILQDDECIADYLSKIKKYIYIYYEFEGKVRESEILKILKNQNEAMRLLLEIFEKVKKNQDSLISNIETITDILKKLPI